MKRGRGRIKWPVVPVSPLVVLACILLAACGFPQARGQNEPPSVTVTEPAPEASVLADSYICVSASASGAPPITRVELWLDGELVDTEESSVVGGISPFDVSFDLLVPQGQHTLFVRAVNAAGLMENSAPVNVGGVEELLSPGATSTSEAPPSPAAPTVQPQEPVEISLLAKEGRVPGNTPVILRFGWEADTSEQVGDFLSSAELVVRLDGGLLDGGQYWSDVEETASRDPNGEANYQTFWRYLVGVLTPGTHQVEAELRLQRPVTDGFDSNGDGVPEEYSGTMPFSLQIVVGQ